MPGISLVVKQPSRLKLGEKLIGKGELAKAEALFKAVLAEDQRNDAQATAHLSIGRILHHSNRYAEAESHLRDATRLAPDQADARYFLAMTLKSRKKFDEAMRTLDDLLAQHPRHAMAQAMLYQVARKACDWDRVAAMEPRIAAHTSQAVATGRQPAETPFGHLTRSDDERENLSVARTWSARLQADADRVNRGPVGGGMTDRDKPRIVVGYVSSDFHNHATSHLLGDFFRLHDRDVFQVNVYSHGVPNRSAYRQRTMRQCDRFVDVRDMGLLETARTIAADGVDILVDLKGHTKDNRMEIFALRPAPVQIAYLGYPGTSGAPFIDYAIVDQTIVPPSRLPHYSEKPIYLPYCYQINDSQQKISDKPVSRATYGIADDAFVFASFNGTQKIDAGTFALWMEIVKAVPGSILFAYTDNPTAAENMRRRAEAAGVDGARLTFAEVLPKAEHLARLRLADLMLDTRIYNGHTTTSDALWAGLPVVAIRGRHFASSVSASILAAVGLPDLVTADPSEYRRLAIALATDRDRLAAVKARLERNKHIFPLFDTARATRDIERGYLAAWDIHRAGEPPRPIDLS